MMIENQINIGLKNLSVGYRQPGDKPLEVLRNLNFTAAPGEMVALIGSNGIGKSTLLRTIAAFQPALAGEITIGGMNLNALTPPKVARIMSFVSTEIIRATNLTVFDMVAYGRFPYTNWFGTLSGEDKFIVQDAIHKVGIEELAQRSVMHISDGERQRTMIARALAQDTPVIILDEPTAYLDVSNKYEIFHLLQVLANERKKTIVLSTHDLNIALREVDKLWIVAESGNYEGAPEDAALNDRLNLMFRNEHIGFDSHEGEFFFRKDFKARVKVEGEGLPLVWTLRALNRKGYQIVMQAESDFSILAKPGKWELLRDNTKMTFDTIYNLLAYLD